MYFRIVYKLPSTEQITTTIMASSAYAAEVILVNALAITTGRSVDDVAYMIDIIFCEKL